MFISKEEIGSTDLLFLSLSEMPSDPSEVLAYGDACARRVLLVPHLLGEGEIHLLPSDDAKRYLPEALLLASRHLLLRRGLPLDELVFFVKDERYRISVFQNNILLNYKIRKQEFTKQRISLSDCTTDVYFLDTDGTSDAVLLCDDVCPLDPKLAFRHCKEAIPSLSSLLLASVEGGTLHLVRTVGEKNEGVRVYDALFVLSLWRRIGCRLPELDVPSLGGVSIALSSPYEGKIRYRLPD